MSERSIVAGIAVLFIFVLFVGKKKKQATYCEYKEAADIGETRKSLEKPKTQRKVCICVTRNECCQINVYCYNLNQEKIGELLAEFIWDNWNMPGKKANAVHLEQIFVQRRQRKKGIGKLMFAYLVREMLVLEKQSGKEFQQIYGEVGRDGSDEPRSSIPFYKRMEKLPYGERKCLSFQLNKGSALDGLDMFTYHIVRK